MNQPIQTQRGLVGVANIHPNLQLNGLKEQLKASYSSAVIYVWREEELES